MLVGGAEAGTSNHIIREHDNAALLDAFRKGRKS